MARYCFCGCGRRVRFTKKRASKLGAKAQRTLGALKTTTLPRVEGNPAAKAQVERLIREGEDIRDLYAGLVHGTRVAPPMNLQVRILEWERDAARIAAESLHQAGDARTRDSEWGRRAATSSRVVGVPESEDARGRALQWFNEVLEFYRRPVSPEIHRLHCFYLRECVAQDGLGVLQDETWSADEISVLITSVVRFGYAFRLYEEQAFQITAPDRVSEVGLRELLQENPGAEAGALVAAVCMNIARPEAHDPFAAIATREGPSNELRALIASISIEAAVESGPESKSARPGSVGDDLLLGAWRYGFGTRLCETALPSGVSLASSLRE